MDRILMLGLARWDNPYASTAWSMALALAEEHEVYYVENPFSLKDYWLRAQETQIQLRKKHHQRRKKEFFQMPDWPEGLKLVIPPPIFPINQLPPGIFYQWAHKINHKKLKKYFLPFSRLHSIHPDLFLNVFNPYYDGLFGHMYPWATHVYYCVDNIQAAPWLSRHGPDWEARAMRRADLCLTTSTHLQRYAEARTNRPVYYLPNGADTQLFSTALAACPRPDDFPAGEGPFLLYHGAIDARIDWELVKGLSLQKPNWQQIWIGPTDQGIISSMKPFMNVHFLGPKEQKALPAYMQHADIGIIPFLKTDFTENIYPLKLHEFQAAGLAVLSTPFSPDLENAEDVLLANDINSFKKAAEKLLSEDQSRLRNDRSRAAAAHSWKARIQQFRAIVYS